MGRSFSFIGSTCMYGDSVEVLSKLRINSLYTRYESSSSWKAAVSLTGALGLNKLLSSLDLTSEMADGKFEASSKGPLV